MVHVVNVEETSLAPASLVQTRAVDRRISGPALLLAFLLTTAVASAQELAPGVRLESDADGVRAELTFAAPEGCVERAQLSAEVEELLGRAPFVLEHGDLRVHIAITSVGNVFTSRIQVAMPYGEVIGERVVETTTTSCAGVVPALGLVVAMLVDVPRHELVVRQESHRNALAFRVAAGAGATHGWLPGDVNALIDLRAGLMSGPFSVDLVVLLVPETQVTLGVARARFWSGVIGGALCGFPLIVDTFHLGVCGEVAGGWIAASGEGLDEVRSVVAPQGTLGLSLRAAWSFAPPVGARVEVGVRAPLARDRFQLSLDSRVYETVFTPSVVMPYATLSFDFETR